MKREHLELMIRVAIKHADLNNTLERHANKIGIIGGIEELREIAQSKEPMHLMDLGMLGMYFLPNIVSIDLLEKLT